MPDIFHDFPTKVSPGRVFEAISTPRGLDAWWTKKSSGRPAEGKEYELWFGPQYDWRGLVTKCVAPSEFELQILRADPDWNSTRVGFRRSYAWITVAVALSLVYVFVLGRGIVLHP